MATVFSATHTSDGTPVAVKVLHPEMAAQTQFCEAFGYEVRAAAQLDHPRITAVFDHGIVGAGETEGERIVRGAPWLAMELVEGGTLASTGSRRWPALKSLLMDVLDGLAHAHARGVIHRDIKPGNILVDDSSQRVKLTDFGLAHSSLGERRGAHSDTHEISGTPAYMAPEQINGLWRDYGPWTDLYGVGTLGWTLATGGPPFTGAVEKVLWGHLQGPLPVFSPLTSVPLAFRDWIERMMAKRPQQRFQRAADAAWALSQIEEADTAMSAVADSSQWVHGLMALDTLVLAPAATTVEAGDEGCQDLQPSAAVPVGGHLPPRAPTPASWDVPRATRRHLHGAGLALFGLRSTGVVGRNAERDKLWGKLLEVAAAGQPRLVVLEGAAGIGKTTLARWLSTRADEVGAADQLLVTHSAVGGPGDGIGVMLHRHLHIAELSREEAVKRVEQHLRVLGAESVDDAIALVQLARPTTSAEDSGAGLTAHFSGPQERRAVLARYLRTLAARRPLVLVVDGLHLEPDSQAFVEGILSAPVAAPILILGTVRAEEVLPGSETAQVLEAILQSDRADRIYLSPLDREGQSALVRELLGLEPTLAAQVEARSAGNPQFAVQLVGDLVQRGLLVAGPHGFALAEGADVQLPADLIGLWEQRLHEVLQEQPEGSIHAIELAAVLGTDVSREEWGEACESAGLGIPEQLLHHLMRLRLVLGADEGKDWSFVHAMFREAVLAHAKRNQRVATWASLGADVLAGRPLATARRARLLLLAGRTQEAIAPLRKAVREQLEMGERDRAIELASLRETAVASLGVGPDSPEHLVTELLRIQCFKKGDQYRNIHEVAPPLIALACKLEDWDAHVSLLINRGAAYVASGDFRQAHAVHLEALALATVHKLHYAISIHNSLCFLSIRVGDHPSAETHARHAIFAGEAHGRSLAVAHGYAMLGRVYRQTDELLRADFCLDEAFVRFERLGARFGLGEVCNTRGEVSRSQGDLDGAKKWYLEAAERFDACGSNAGAFSRMNLGMTCLEARDFSAAMDLFNQVETEFESLQEVGPLMATRVFRLPCFIASEDWDKIAADLALSIPVLQETGLIDLDLARFSQMTAQLLEDAGQAQLSRKLWQIALSQWESLDRPDEAAEASAALARRQSS
jgi:tetratricopeptide (TPR) repeat protein